MATTRTLPPDLVLAKGSHQEPGGIVQFQACFVEAAAYIAGESWTDHPECVCPVIAAFGRSWNDAMSDEDRQILVPYITRIVGTRSTPEVEQRRAWMTTDWLVREYTPAWLRLAGLNDQAHTLEQLVALTDTATAREAQLSVAAARAAARAAAGDAARAAAGDAARAAAWAATRAAAWAAAWDAARAAAGDAARAAAWAATRAAAWAATRAAAGDALRPTVKALQVSALALLDRMIEGGGVRSVADAELFPFSPPRGRRKGGGQRWTPAEIIQAISAWVWDFGGPPTCGDWQRASRRNPTTSTVIDRFGSWTAALAAAGCEGGVGGVRRTYDTCPHCRGTGRSAVSYEEGGES